MKVTLPSGVIVGFEEPNGITKFLGVPYAHIPQRFELATDALKWSGEKECSKSFNYPQNETIAARLPTLLSGICFLFLIT